MTSYSTQAEAIAAAQTLCESDGKRRVVTEYLRTDGGDGRFYIEFYNVADSLFYNVGKQKQIVVNPTIKRVN